MELEGNAEIVRLLNGLLTTELRAINQYFLDSKMAGHWGLEGLEKEFRDASFEEMRDAESLMDRILLLGGLPNLQRTDTFSVGESVSEQFELAAELETKAVEQLHQATSLMLRGMLVEEEAQLDWAETELSLIDKVGVANYMSQKMRA
jgi:bacterioferritin